MGELSGIEPYGPRQLPVGQLTDEDFQELCVRLIRLEFPDARSTANPDGGADALLARPGGGWERAWQAKRYTNNIYWSKCRESLDRAVATYEIAQMTFCFARDLTARQHRQLQEKLVGRHPRVVVDFWDLSELRARLDESEAGKRVARHYFADSVQNAELMARAFRAGGPLETAENVLERGRPIGEFLSSNDPFFSYPSRQFEDGIQAPLTPGAIMAVGRTENGVTVRLDAVPRDEDALARYAPRLRIDFDPTELGKAAARAIDHALRKHEPVTIEDGAQITAERLPPLFREYVGKPVRGTIQLTPEPRPAWAAVFHLISDRGDETLRIRLDPMPRPPPGYLAGFRGHFAGLTTTIMARWIEGRGGELRAKWQYAVDEAPARQQLEVLRFLSALHGKGQLKLGDDLGRPEFTYPLRPRSFGLEHLLRFMEDVVTIEDWTGEEVVLPDEVDSQETTWVAEIAHAIRRRALLMRWESTIMGVDPEELAKMPSPAAVRIEQELNLTLLGQPINLGYGVLDIQSAEVRDLGPVEGNERIHRVELRPLGGGVLKSDWAIAPPND